MGHFYQNYTVRGASRDEVAAFLSRRAAFIGPVSNDCFVVFDRRSEDESNTELGLDLSEQFNCPVLAVTNHDDDLLFYQLFEGVLPVDEYSSCPGYFDPAEPDTPTGGDAQRLCAAFSSTAVTDVQAILRKPSDESGYVFCARSPSGSSARPRIAWLCCRLQLPPHFRWRVARGALRVRPR